MCQSWILPWMLIGTISLSARGHAANRSRSGALRRDRSSGPSSADDLGRWQRSAEPTESAARSGRHAPAACEHCGAGRVKGLPGGRALTPCSLALVADHGAARHDREFRKLRLVLG